MSLLRTKHVSELETRAPPWWRNKQNFVTSSLIDNLRVRSQMSPVILRKAANCSSLVKLISIHLLAIWNICWNTPSLSSNTLAPFQPLSSGRRESICFCWHPGDKTLIILTKSRQTSSPEPKYSPGLFMKSMWRVSWFVEIAEVFCPTSCRLCGVASFVR